MIKDVKIQKAGAACSLCGQPLRDVTRHPSILRWIAEHDGIESPPGNPHAEETADAAGALEPTNGSLAKADTPAQNSDQASSSRLDVCPDCWAKDHQLDYLCYWLARRKPPKEREKKDRKGRNAFLRELFYHYYNYENEPSGEGRPKNTSEEESADEADASPEGTLTEAPLKSPDELERERDLHLYLLAHLLMRYKVFQWKGAKTDRKKRRWLQFNDTAQDQTVKIADMNPDDPALAAVHGELAALLAE